VNLFYIQCWVKAPRRRKRVTGTYYMLAVLASDGHAAETAVRKKYHGCELRGGTVATHGPKVVVTQSWQTED
jgi:hypothetical protein